VKWPLPMSGIGNPATGLLLWGWVGATADESIIALRTDIWWSVPYGTRTAVLYFDRGGNRLFNTVLPYDPGIEPVALSPNGRYLAYRDGGEEIGPFTLHVATLDGAVVASLPDGADPTWFMSDGSLAVCVRPFGTGTPTTQRWDLFTASTPLTDPQWSNGCQIVAAG
jgi:hypothetical protein